METIESNEPAFIVKHREHMTANHSHPSGMGGVQVLFTFPNGWGASVVRTPWTYGGPLLWELAVIGRNGRLNYEHPVSEGDVRGHLSDDDVARLLSEIAASPEASS